MYNDPNQPYGQPPQQPGEVPPTQYAPQPPYGQPAPPPYGQPPAYEPPPAYGQPPQPPPYGQPPYGQPPYGQPPYGQPPYGGVPPLPNVPPGYAAPAPQKSRKGLWITLGIIAGVFVLACAICGSLALFANNGPDSTVKDYYKAVQSQDYATAYTYLAPGASFTDPQSNKNIPITSQAVYTLAAKTLDKDLGMLTDYQTSDGSDTNHVNVSVTRGGKQYAIHLTMTKVDGKWKILNADGI